MKRRKIIFGLAISIHSVCVSVCVCVCLSIPFAWEKYDTKSVFQRSLIGLNSEFPNAKPLTIPTLKNPVYNTIYT